MAIFSATSNSAVGQIGVFLILGLGCLVGFLLSNYFGLVCVALGFLSTPITYLVVNVLAGFYSDATSLAYVCRIYWSKADYLYRISWATSNYQIYSSLINVGGMFLANFLSIGVILILANQEKLIIWNELVIFGILMGSGLTYFLKG